MNEKMSKRRIQIRDLQKQEIEEKEERRLLISKEMQIRNPFAFTVPQIMKIEIQRKDFWAGQWSVIRCEER